MVTLRTCGEFESEFFYIRRAYELVQFGEVRHGGVELKIRRVVGGSGSKRLSDSFHRSVGIPDDIRGESRDGVAQSIQLLN